MSMICHNLTSKISKSRKMISPQVTSKILKEAQTGTLATLKQIKSEIPDFHWSVLRYPKTGDTILHVAAKLGHLDTIKYLISSVFKPKSIDCKNNDDKTALHESCQFSQSKVVELLIKNGADINALKRADWTPLMLACTKNNLETVDILLKQNNLLVDYKNKDGWTACHLICREGSTDILNLLLNHGADYTSKTKNGRSCLQIASLHGNIKIVEILLNLNVNVDECDNCGNTALHEAVLGNNLVILKVLACRTENVFCVNHVGFNLLHLASGLNYCELIEVLISDFKFDVDCKSSGGFTAMHCAARKRQTEAFDMLVKLGADELIKDSCGRIALDYLKM